MYSVQAVFHIFNLLLFIASTITYGRLLWKAWQLPDDAPIGRRKSDMVRSVAVFRMLAITLCAVSIGLSLVFVVLQFDWVVSDYNQVVGGLTSWAWLVWSYLLAMYLLTLATIGHVLFEWRGGLPSEMTDERRPTGYYHSTRPTVR